VRTARIGTFAATVIALSGCGSSGTFQNKPRPPVPVNVTVYISNDSVSVSPNSVGAGPVVFIVTNQADSAESLTITSSAGKPGATTGPINPQATAQVTVPVDPGSYTIGTTPRGATEAALATASPIQPATLHVGAPRPSGSGTLLQP
jgi:hypothetical protein